MWFKARHLMELGFFSSKLMVNICVIRHNHIQQMCQWKKSDKPKETWAVNKLYLAHISWNSCPSVCFHRRVQQESEEQICSWVQNGGGINYKSVRGEWRAACRDGSYASYFCNVLIWWTQKQTRKEPGRGTKSVRQSSLLRGQQESKHCRHEPFIYAQCA